MSMPELLKENLTAEHELLWTLNTLHTTVNELGGVIKKHHKVLIEGNGELPIVEQVRNLNTFVNGVRYWMKFLIGALLLQTMAFLGTAIAYFIKLGPVIDQLSKNSP
jgi:hypothetical protein